MATSELIIGVLLVVGAIVYAAFKRMKQPVQQQPQPEQKPTQPEQKQ